jgi:hypothetical protein
MTTNKYFALWHYCESFGTRGAAAISENPDSLMKLHQDNIKNPNSRWYGNKVKVNEKVEPIECYTHNSVDNISEIKVEPIECYAYNSDIKMIEPYNDSHIADDHAFYAVNSSSCFDNIFGLPFYDNVTIKITDSGGEVLDSNDYDLDKGEFLVYMSKTVYDEWMYYHILYEKSDDQDNFMMDPEIPSFFYTEWTSHLSIEPDVYYEDGIMNA